MISPCPKHLELEFWRMKPVIFFDVETTSKYPYIDGEPNKDFHILQIYAEKWENMNKVDTFHDLYKPPISIPPEATKIHKITDDDVKDEQPFSKKVNNLVAFIKSGDILCAYNAPFDIKALNVEFNRCNKGHINMPFIDPLTWARTKRGKMSGNKLHQVARRFGVGKMSKVEHEKEFLHDAKTDVEILSDLLWKMAENYPLPMTLGRVIEQQNRNWKKHERYFKETYGD